MNFTKEYISLCKNNKVQELRPDEVEIGDWYIDPNYYMAEKEPLLCGVEYIGFIPTDTIMHRDKVIWLPTGNQLDEEIIKICRKKRGLYEFKYYSKLNLYTAEIMFTAASNFVETSKGNPLIAKLKLLIQLLGDE
jgi:hypothetical protein